MNLQRSTHALRVPAGGAIGLVAAACGLAIAELVSSASHTFQSPVLDVGDRVVDGVPNSIKTLAIDWFGTNDKSALLIGIGAVLAVYAAALGVDWHSPASGDWRIVGIAGFGLIGASHRRASSSGGPIVGGVAELRRWPGWRRLALWHLRRCCLGDRADGRIERQDRTLDRPSSTSTPITTGRRRFLLATLGLAAAGAFAVGASGRTLATRSDVDGCVTGVAHAPGGDTTVAARGPGINSGIDRCCRLLHRQS